jgi:hypothetical protein
VIRKIRANEGVQAIRDDLENTRSRLAKDRDAQYLAPRIQSLIAALDALLAQVPAGGKVDNQTLAGFVTRANEERCGIFGELTGTVCTAGKRPGWAKRFFQQPALLVSTASLDPTRQPRPRKGSSPLTAEGWRELAQERARDAEALEDGRPDTAGPVYMAGYAIECSLKAYLHERGIAFPTSGREGHNLRGLWEAAGFRLKDLKDVQGAMTYYIEHWSTDLRYAKSTGSSLSTDMLMDGARQLSTWIQNRMKRKGKAR